MVNIAELAMAQTANKLGECSAAESAVVTGIYVQRSNEIYDKLPPDPGIDAKQELSRVNEEIELLRSLVKSRGATSPSPDPTPSVVVSPANNRLP